MSENANPKRWPNVARKGDPDFVWAGHGGCWFCYRDDGEMAFDTEFDTYVHLECLRAVLDVDRHHPEAKPMAYLLPKGDEP